MFVMARDPSAVENDGVRVDDDGDTEDINEEDVRETPFEVTITVKEVNEKPVVRQADEGNTNDPGILVVSTMEISTVCIKENRPLAMEDDDATEDVDESQLANVVTNNNICDPTQAQTVDYTFTAGGRRRRHRTQRDIWDVQARRKSGQAVTVRRRRGSLRAG